MGKPSDRHVNHRGWMVIMSIASADASLCVDWFEDPGDATFGFEHFRADPETGGFAPIGGFGSTRFATLDAAADAAIDAVPWLGNELLARATWESWRDQL